MFGKIKLNFELALSHPLCPNSFQSQHQINLRAAGHGPCNAINSFLVYLINFRGKGMLCRAMQESQDKDVSFKKYC